MLRFTIAVLPWLIPGIVLSMIVASFASRPVAKALATRRAIAWAIIVGFGVIVSATLTPLNGALNFEAVATGTCDFSRIGVAPIEQLLRVNDSSLNVALFIPLGMAIGLVHVSRPWAALILASIALPFAIEAIQLVAPILDRGCQSADVFDNLTGLALGLVIGTGLRVLGGETQDDREVGR